MPAIDWTGDELEFWNKMLSGAHEELSSGESVHEAAFWKQMTEGAHKYVQEHGVSFPQFARRFLDEVEDRGG